MLSRVHPLDYITKNQACKFSLNTITLCLLGQCDSTLGLCTYKFTPVTTVLLTKASYPNFTYVLITTKLHAQ
jgi:hypothetical protein